MNNTNNFMALTLQNIDILTFTQLQKTKNSNLWEEN